MKIITKRYKDRVDSEGHFYDEYITEIPDKVEVKEKKSDIIKILDAVEKIPSPYIPTICEILETAVKAFENPDLVKKDILKIKNTFFDIKSFASKIRSRLGDK